MGIWNPLSIMINLIHLLIKLLLWNVPITIRVLVALVVVHIPLILRRLYEVAATHISKVFISKIFNVLIVLTWEAFIIWRVFFTGLVTENYIILILYDGRSLMSFLMCICHSEAGWLVPYIIRQLSLGLSLTVERWFSSKTWTSYTVTFTIIRKRCIIVECSKITTSPTNYFTWTVVIHASAALL